VLEAEVAAADGEGRPRRVVEDGRIGAGRLGERLQDGERVLGAVRLEVDRAEEGEDLGRRRRTTGELLESFLGAGDVALVELVHGVRQSLLHGIGGGRRRWLGRDRLGCRLGLSLKRGGRQAGGGGKKGGGCVYESL